MIGKSLSHFLFLTLEIKYSAVSVRSEMEQLYHCKGVGELGLLILSKTSLVKSGPSTLSNTLFFVFFWRFVCRFCLRRDKLICKAPVVVVIIRLVFVYP